MAGSLHFRWVLSLGLLAWALASPRAAFAQTAEQRAAARALALEGSTAFKEQRWDDTIRYFTRAEEMVHAPPHLLFAAKAHLELKHLVEANDLLLKVKNETLPPNAPPAFQRAQEEAFELLQQIKPRLSYLAVDVTNTGNQPFEIQVDAGKLDAVFRGVPKAVNPGEHKVSALADGMRAPEQMVVVQEGERKKVDLELKPDPSARLTPLAAPAPEQKPVEAALAASTDTSKSDQGTTSTEKPGWLKIAPYAAFGVGAVGLGLGTVFALSSAGKRSDADAAEKKYVASCKPNCSNGSAEAKKIHALDSDAGSAQTIAIIGFVVGGLGVAGGAALLLLDPGGSGSGSSESAQAGLYVTPVVGLGTAGANLAGTF